ncbi:F-box/FBD/LRR-repeat protein At4g00160-like [Triticum dicoccoides]|uniref:F-box/FBD/LRR-repeat protein At4g00160-like n=1 Tax=Triticum dicoccoides TaxID=85692 RepID=UPI001891ABCB|nr:F-box/FBD/LRR-repeat protein At4g00160-like [Triticum dicoccoides]
MAKSSRRRRAAKLNAKKGSRDDRISSLPNDILVNILDRLDVRDAVRTSVLSRRWSQLPAMLPQLRINAQDILPSKIKTGMSDDELVRMSNAVVIKATKSILARRDPVECTIRLFSATFYLSDDAPLSVGHAVGSAMVTHKIEKAEFRVLTQKKRLECTIGDMLTYGKRFVLFFNKCLNAFAGLTRLCLQNLRFAESDFVSNILVTCKQLNYLGFLNCDTKSWITLQVEHAQLSELSIVNCRFDMVELTWLPKLTCLAFEIWIAFNEPPLSFGYVPLLEVLSLSNVAYNRHKMVKLSTFLGETSVLDLKLGFKCEKIWVQPECLAGRQAHVFHQLRILRLFGIPEGYDLTWTMFFLEAAPSLEELYMTVVDHPCEMEMDEKVRRRESYSENKGVQWESPTPNFKHHRLTKLAFFCFQSEEYMVSHVRRVMKAAVNLGDVYLYDRVTCIYCEGVEPLKPIVFPKTDEQMSSVEKQIREGTESPAIIHFLSAAEISDDYLARICEDG